MQHHEYEWKFTQRDIDEFIDIWAEEYNEYITEDQALMEMKKLCDLCWLLVQPLPGERE